MLNIGDFKYIVLLFWLLMKRNPGHVTSLSFSIHKMG